MKAQPQLASMIKNQSFDGFLLVRAATQRTSSNGSKYLDMTLVRYFRGSQRQNVGWANARPRPGAGIARARRNA